MGSITEYRIRFCFTAICAEAGLILRCPRVAKLTVTISVAVPAPGEKMRSWLRQNRQLRQKMTRHILRLPRDPPTKLLAITYVATMQIPVTCIGDGNFL